MTNLYDLSWNRKEKKFETFFKWRIAWRIIAFINRNETPWYFSVSRKAKNKKILWRDRGETFRSSLAFPPRFSSEKKKMKVSPGSFFQFFEFLLSLPCILPFPLSSRDEKTQRWHRKYRRSSPPFSWISYSPQPRGEKKKWEKEKRKNIADLSRGCRPSSFYATVSLSIGYTPAFYLWCLHLIDGILPSKLLMDGLYLASFSPPPQFDSYAVRAALKYTVYQERVCFAWAKHDNRKGKCIRREVERRGGWNWPFFSGGIVILCVIDRRETRWKSL